MSDLPANPDLDWLRKDAKRRLRQLRRENPAAQLADAQLAVAREHGFPSWRALKTYVDSRQVDGRLFEAARTGDLATLTALVDAHPDKLHVREPPYEWSLLHAAADKGRLAIVDELLRRGLDPNTREKGDNTYPMHWAAAAGHLDIVRRLADGGGDVIGAGDDHHGHVIGWATCGPGGDDDAHRAVADFLVSRGARHHIFSAIALDLADEVRRLVAADRSVLEARQSRFENQLTPLHFAHLKKRPAMIRLLLDLGADPLAVDGSGQPVAFYAGGVEDDVEVMGRIRSTVAVEFRNAERENRSARGGSVELLALLSARDWESAARLLKDNPSSIDPSGGILHLAAGRGDLDAARWLLAHGADVNGRWSSQGADVTPLHSAAARGHLDMIRLLLDAGADATIKDSQHDSAAVGWAEYFNQPEAVRLLTHRMNQR